MLQAVYKHARDRGWSDTRAARHAWNVVNQHYYRSRGRWRLRSRPLREPNPRARAEHADIVTRLPAAPGVGTFGTGRWVTRVKVGKTWVPVQVDPEELLREDVSVKIDPDALEFVRDRARQQLRAGRQSASKGRKVRARIARTYRTAGEGAKAFVANNEPWVSEAVEADPHDAVRDWLNGIDVRRGRGTRRLSATKKGQELLGGFKGARRGASSAEAVIRWILSRNRSRRWADVEWDLVDSFGETLATAHPGTWAWYPPGSGRAAGSTLVELGETAPAQAAQLRAERNLETLLDDIAALRRAYKEAKECMGPPDRKATERRLRQLRKLAKTPELIERTYLCEPEGRDQVCGFPAVEAEIERLRRACEVGYQAAGVARTDGLRTEEELEVPWENPRRRKKAGAKQAEMFTTEQVGFALTSPEGEGRRVRVPTATQQTLFEMERPSLETMRERKKNPTRKAVPRRKTPKRKAAKRKAAKRTTTTTTTTKRVVRVQNPGKPLKRGPVPLDRLDGSDLTDLHNTRVVEVQAGGQVHRWTPGPRLYWWPETRAFVWYQGVGRLSNARRHDGTGRAAATAERWDWTGRKGSSSRVLNVPAMRGEWRGLGAADHLAYRSDKSGTPQTYEHKTSARLYRFGGKGPPWVWVLKGPRLRVTSKGIEG